MHWDEYEYWCSREPIYFRSFTRTPPALQACRESRACLEASGNGGGGYTKAFAGGSDPIYTWVNFAVNTICADYRFEVILKEEHERIVRLALHCGMGADSEFFGHDELVADVASSNVEALALSETGPIPASYEDYWLQV
ncbi:hypothetical protein PG996_008796 [Apiospora saccharicola]|uniref:Uncharacterized protein n=1 Tax=Apiospora saccharicola TaxID=335842 RepID=A0ABR1V261_9PEZI